MARVKWKKVFSGTAFGGRGCAKVAASLLLPLAKSPVTQQHPAHGFSG
jgi:hypothetical protein